MTKTIVGDHHYPELILRELEGIYGLIEGRFPQQGARFVTIFEGMKKRYYAGYHRWMLNLIQVLLPLAQSKNQTALLLHPHSSIAFLYGGLYSFLLRDRILGPKILEVDLRLLDYLVRYYDSVQPREEEI